MGSLGIEPRAYQLKAEYSTIELATLLNSFYYNREYNILKHFLLF